MNCAAIPESLAESQLFGVNSGAYTGAVQSRAGFVEAAHLGTLYLDEIDSMPLSLQAKLLRVLECRGVERLGSTRFISVDMRVIASAQQSLQIMVDQGAFRRDLYFRLNVVNIELPALRDRRERIIPLFLQMIQEEADQFNCTPPSPSDGLLHELLCHPWLGNVRELRSAAIRFVLGLPPLEAGLASLPMTLTIMVVAGVATRLLPVVGPRLLMIAGPIIAAVGLLYLSRITADGAYLVQVLPALIVLGVGMAMIFVPVQNLALTGVAAHDAGAAGATANAAMQIGGSVGLSIFTTIYAGAVGSAPSPAAFVDGYSAVFLTAAIGLVFAAVVAATMIRVKKEEFLAQAPQEAVAHLG